MQVKKFEARSMKEALEMVKAELGPDAIILSARDNNKSYGLVGDGSVEITAAVSEETLRKKKFTESRLREQDRQTFAKTSARTQKDLITKMVASHMEKNQPPKAITSQRYIDIEDERQQQQQQDTRYNSLVAEERIRNAAQRALTAMQDQIQPALKKAPTPAPAVAKTLPGKSIAESEEMLALKKEIAGLKQVLAQFHQVPQNFVQGHPGADFGLPYDLSFMFEKLTQAGIANDIAADICQQVGKNMSSLKLKNRALVEGWVARHILESTQVSTQAKEGKVHVFIGAAGSGKTSALVKMASHLVIRENKKVAIFTADTFKVGATDQMRIFAQILNVPFSVIRNGSDWYQIMNYVNSVDYILVDCPGLSLRNAEEGLLLKRLLPPPAMKARVHLVMSTLTKDQDATELGRRYSVLGYQDVIFTCLDESSQHGSIYNFMKRFEVPLHSFGVGPRVPEDFEFATKERVLDLLFKITQVKQQEQNTL